MMDMDFVLGAWTSALVKRAHGMWMLGAGRRWQPGQPLKLLLATYNGERNTGSDVRVEEIVRQIRAVLGENNVSISVMTQNLALTKGYFECAEQVHLPDIFPPFLYREVRKYDGVIACEGSTFKSKFSNALTTMFIGALGIASSENKISLGYGVEAGQMDSGVAKMCAKYGRRSLVITRNEESQAVLSKLGVPTELGTDTAWTFEPLSSEYGRKALLDCGWDGRKPVLALCPINPYWWPVKPSVLKFLGRTFFGAYKTSQYRSIYFHKSGPEVDAAFQKYLSAMAGAANAFRAKHDVFTVLVAMERLDTKACNALAPQMGGVPVLSSEAYDMYQMVSILRGCTLMVSSSFHAMVTSMPAGVASAGVTMDERIRTSCASAGKSICC